MQYFAHIKLNQRGVIMTSKGLKTLFHAGQFTSSKIIFLPEEVYKVSINFVFL